jgi:hypothetical protein
MEYRVTWTIDLDADSPESAADQALAIHRDPQSSATVFTVTDMDDHSVVVGVTQLPPSARPLEPLPPHLTLRYSGDLTSEWWVDCAECARECNLEMDGASWDEAEAAVFAMGWHLIQRPGPGNTDEAYVCDACYTASPDGVPADEASHE